MVCKAVKERCGLACRGMEWQSWLVSVCYGKPLYVRQSCLVWARKGWAGYVTAVR